MIELLQMALIGGLLGTSVALIGVPQIRVFDSIIVFCNGMLLLALLVLIYGM